jgi:hypothetical protein
MANIPPLKFYKLSKADQEQFAIRKMRDAYEEADQWKRLSVQARHSHIPEPKELERPDEVILKEPS